MSSPSPDGPNTQEVNQFVTHEISTQNKWKNGKDVPGQWTCGEHVMIRGP